jgi:uncharacterized membrane protein YeaQ/YmgE (transglycosylase-associated protein family)
MKVSRIAKVAGASLVGFVAVSLAADKASVAPMASQVAGFVGAFFGSLVASRRAGSKDGRSGGSSAETPPVGQVAEISTPDERTQIDQ